MKIDETKIDDVVLALLQLTPILILNVSGLLNMRVE